jgi:N-acetyl-gamma-glutamylphosphate reductase
MSAPSIILIGAGGYLGGPVTVALLANRSRFNRIAILTEESKKQKFAEQEAKGFELIIGALDSSDSFKGSVRHSSMPHELTRT